MWLIENLSMDTFNLVFNCCIHFYSIQMNTQQNLIEMHVWQPFGSKMAVGPIEQI